MEAVKKKKFLFLCTTSQTVYNFRLGLIKFLQENGYEVLVVTFDEEYKALLNEEGVKIYCITEKNRSLNPFKILALKKTYMHIIKDYSPDVVFSFMLKPNTFGVMAAKAAGVKNIYSMVEGAGDVFMNNSLKWKIIRFVVCRLYKKAFKSAEKVFFLNKDDKKEFIERKLVKENQCEIVRGIGVDLEKFAFKPLKNKRTFLMIARMLKTKGVFEYCKAARIVKQKYPDAVFNYLGGEGTLKVSDIQEYIDDGSVNYLGTTKDVRPYLEDCMALLLPSYREGLPMSIMEAEAVGRAIIASDSVGCRDTVVDEYNGFLVPQKDYEMMAEKCIWLVENFEKAEDLGRNARKFAEENFDPKKINQRIYEVINIESTQQ